ncbi:MAG TPA: tetratricopeptide repeat protein [Candidatus Cybelea sp.]|nr:tetratricopeptide repeat protein [Candidatus Cybelea sp.]
MDAQTQTTDRYLNTVQWLHDRRKPLLVGSAVVAVLCLAWAFWAWKNAKNEADANTQFFAAPLESSMRSMALSPEPLLEVSREYPNTAAGEHAQVLAAEELFTQGKFPEALRQFNEFVDTYPDSALIPQAKLGVAASLEAQGKATEAIAKYREIIGIYPTEMSIISPAKLTLARLYEETGQLQQALSAYAELARVLNQNPQDPWASEARERAQLLASQHPELMKALTSAAQSAPTNGIFNSDVLEAPDVKSAKASAVGATNAAKTSSPPGPSGNEIPNLLSIPGVSTNSTNKP